MALSAREQVELWLTSHPRQYFTTEELAKAIHFHAGTVRKVLAVLRSEGWQFEQYGGGATTHQRYLGQGDAPALEVMGRKRTKVETRKQERERLRLALERIVQTAEASVSGDTSAPWAALGAIVEMARAALGDAG